MEAYNEMFFTQFANQWELVHEDKRRRIEEVNHPSFCVQRYTIHTELGLGNHYHQVLESFFFVYGTGIIYLVPVVNGQLNLEKRWKVEVGPGSNLEVPPNTAHLFMMKAGAIFFCHSPTSFEAKWKATTNLVVTPW